MKNKIYALALSLGIFSPLSCAMESHFYPANPNISSGYFSRVPVQSSSAKYGTARGFAPYGSVSSGSTIYGSAQYRPAPYGPVPCGPVPCPGSCSLMPSGPTTYGSIQYRPALYPAPYGPVPCPRSCGLVPSGPGLFTNTTSVPVPYIPASQGGLSRISGVKILDQHCIDYVNAKDDLQIYKVLNEICKQCKDRKIIYNQIKICKFIDYFGREYYDIPLKAAISRCGLLNYCVYISKTKTDTTEIDFMLDDFKREYEKEFGSALKFKTTAAKTELIHFVEDAILRPLYGETLCMHYRDLISYLRYFYYSAEYGTHIMNAWKEFLHGNLNDSNFTVHLFNDATARTKVDAYVRGLYTKRSLDDKKNIK